MGKTLKPETMVARSTGHLIDAKSRVRKLRRWLSRKADVLAGQGKAFEAEFLRGLEGYIALTDGDIVSARREVEQLLNTQRIVPA